jgi:competence protein ComEC
LTYLVSFSLMGIASGDAVRAGGRWRAARDAGAVLAAAQASAWPLVLAHFGWASPLFLVSNAVLVPLCGLLMPVLCGSLFIGSLAGLPAALGCAPAQVAVRGYLAGSEVLGRLCDRWVLGCGLDTDVALVASLAAAIACNIRPWPRGVRLAAAAAIAGIVTVTALWFEPEPRILVLDVGQGDSCILAWAGETWVVDTGPVPATAGRPRWALSRALRRLGRARIDRLLLTHADLDHCGGVQEILAAGVPVGVVHHPAGWDPPDWLREAIGVLQRRGAAVRPLAAGDLLCAADARGELLHPPRDPGSAAPGDNEGCLALRIVMGNWALILPGDAPGEVERSWIDAGRPLRADVLAAAHHGSRGATPPELLEAVGPRLLLISAGRWNAFGHPHREVLERARARGCAVLRTDRDGSILLALGRGGWFARPWVRRRALALGAEARASAQQASGPP